jgi:hypothetical protein
MATQSSVESAKIQGPSGFIEHDGNMLVVDYGVVLDLSGFPVGFLFEDGYLRDTSGPLGDCAQLRPIEDVEGKCTFRGIDCRGLELILPQMMARGPSGALTYNDVPFHVINGRICTQEHKLAGHIDDQGAIYVRDHRTGKQHLKIAETSQLSTTFSGTKSTGEKLKIDFTRQIPAYRKDKPNSANEIIRYFTDYDKVNTAQKKYVLDSLELWARSGILPIVRKSEGDAGLMPNVKHGAAGVTAVRTGRVHLDKEEFEKEVGYFNKWGTFAVVKPDQRLFQYLEVRINLVVAHEFGHQLEFVLSQKTQDQIRELYDRKKANCNKVHPLPNGYQGHAELVQIDRVVSRVFISGYSRSSWHEYWAEAVAAFSTKEGRLALKQHDPAVHEILYSVITKPETVMRPVFSDTIMEMQASCRLGGELDDNILE